MAYTKYIVIKDYDSPIKAPPEMFIEYSPDKQEFYFTIDIPQHSSLTVCVPNTMAKETLLSWSEMFKEAVNAIP